MHRPLTPSYHRRVSPLLPWTLATLYIMAVTVIADRPSAPPRVGEGRPVARLLARSRTAIPGFSLHAVNRSPFHRFLRIARPAQGFVRRNIISGTRRFSSSRRTLFFSPRRCPRSCVPLTSPSTVASTRRRELRSLRLSGAPPSCYRRRPSRRCPISATRSSRS
jgi:hypothetical protein